MLNSALVYCHYVIERNNFPDIKYIIHNLKATSPLLQWEVLWNLHIFCHPVVVLMTVRLSVLRWQWNVHFAGSHFQESKFNAIRQCGNEDGWGERDNSFISRLYVCSNLEQSSVNTVWPPKGDGWMQSSPLQLSPTMWNGNSTSSATVERIQCLCVRMLRLSVLTKQSRAAV